ncbi:hypothetical protein FQA47_003814 [Oryzias melastigma]|uniref:Uncharacterized protein n=1 Tax=Oryzias melastigma TaxID=30732 RepID=A0A834CMM8_ORYME|nr:hypothetical protein FQA47_003814 [Oryzias melastigma]
MDHIPRTPTSSPRIGFGRRTKEEKGDKKTRTEERSTVTSIHPSTRRRGRSGGGVAGLARAVLGFQERCCPLKMFVCVSVETVGVRKLGFASGFTSGASSRSRNFGSGGADGNPSR